MCSHNDQGQYFRVGVKYMYLYLYLSTNFGVLVLVLGLGLGEQEVLGTLLVLGGKVLEKIKYISSKRSSTIHYFLIMSFKSQAMERMHYCHQFMYNKICLATSATIQVATYNYVTSGAVPRDVFF